MKDDWLLGLFVTWFFVLTGLGVYQLQGDAASTSDQQDVALTADAQAEIETKTNERMTDKAQRSQETSPLKSTEDASRSGSTRPE